MKVTVTRLRTVGFLRSWLIGSSSSPLPSISASVKAIMPASPMSPVPCTSSSLSDCGMLKVMSSKSMSFIRSSNWSSSAASWSSEEEVESAEVSEGRVGAVMAGSPWKSPSFGAALERDGPISPVRMRSKALNASLISSLMAESCSATASSRPMESMCIDTRRTCGSAPKLNAAMSRPMRRL